MGYMVPQRVSGHAQKGTKTGPKEGTKEGPFRGVANHPQEGKTPVLRVLAGYILHTTSVHHTYTCTLYVRTYVHIMVLLQVHTYTRTMYLHTYIAYGMVLCTMHSTCSMCSRYTPTTCPKEDMFLVCSGTTNNKPSWYTR